MAYATQAEVEGQIAPQVLRDQLDDDRDGVADTGLLTQIITTCSAVVDGYLAGLFTVPFEDPEPATVRSAALMFVCEALYARRMVQDSVNPFTTRAKTFREILGKIGTGKMQLSADVARVTTVGAAITADMAIDEGMG